MQAQTFELPDGTRTVVKWFGADTTPDKGLVAFLPALGVKVEFYSRMAEALAQLGYRVAAIEMRGMGDSSVRDVRRHNFGYNEVLNIDLATVVPALKREAGDKPFLLAGHSLGGQFALLYASQHPGEVNGVILIAGGSNFYGSMPEGAQLKRRVGLGAVHVIARTLGFFPGHKLGFGGKQPMNMMLDWTQEALTGRYKVKGDSTDYDRALGQLDLPVLLLSLSGDALVPKPCADFLARKLRQARVTQVELQAKDYGMESFHHFRWAKKAEPVLERVDAWIRAEVGQRSSAREETPRWPESPPSAPGL
ncbi:alpha/beta fold hydrolase [Archangium violaceum]|uniref:alpha/beta hydrolase family protein n=1 Tax=Archangium violaceum TaxID=83451 RepID=UPI002B29442D|nr:alpha/beta fold hydrolase [Archangium violaceum]